MVGRSRYVSPVSLRAVQRVMTVFLLLLSCGGVACDDESAADSEAAEEGASGPEWRTAVAIIDELPHCDIDHRGQLLDLGTGALRGRLGHLLDPPLGVVTTEHDGGNWSRIFDRKLTLTFHLPQVTPIFVSMRAIGRDASRVDVLLDGKMLGSVKLKRDDIHIGSTRVTRLPVDAGLHRLTLRFRGRKKTETAPYAEIDWIRIGVPDDLERTYGAPTLDDLIDPAAQLANVPHRSLSMRAPGAVRCVVRVPPQSRLRASVGMHGTGRGAAAVLVREEGKDPLVLKRVDVKGGGDATWTDVEVPLHGYAGRIVSIELSAAETTGTGRLMIGDPVIEVPVKPMPKWKEAKAVVVVVLDGVERTDLPPWRRAKSPHLSALSRLANESTVFHDHRSPSTLVSAVMASLLTGLSPRHHTVADSGAVLPPSLRTIGGIALEASVSARMFTGVPTSFEPFGFGEHWDQFTQYPPNEGRLASAPMDDAGDWLETAKLEEGERPMLAVLHTRGGHPPWEVTPAEADTLPPTDYAGALSPRLAAQKLAHTEGRHSRISDADRERMAALFHASLARQDEALGRLVLRLKEKGLWDDTLFIVTADVASGRQLLFMDGGDLDEDLLRVPLYVHFPGGRHGGVRVDHPTEIYDITHTVLLALGLKASEDMLGEDLDAIASYGATSSQRIRAAFIGTSDGLGAREELFSVRWGDFVLRGTVGKRPQLCLLSIDPTCAFDRTHQHPATAQALFRRLVRFGRKKANPSDGIRLRLTPEQSAWLDVWGSYYKHH